MVLRVEKVLQGDPDDVREPYSKLDDEKGMKKAKAKVNEVRTPHFSQYFFFSFFFCSTWSFHHTNVPNILVYLHLDDVVSGRFLPSTGCLQAAFLLGDSAAH